jgi:DNA (cytosine-5)-methyltransferase 1
LSELNDRKYETDEKVLNYLKQFNFSLDGKKQCPFEKLKKIDINKLRRLCLANIRTKNIGSILDIKGDTLDKYVKTDGEINLLTYSFPCQDLSVASMGRGLKGMEKNSGTRSGLL